METDNIKNIAFWIMILVVIALAIYMIWFVKTESYQCIANPLVYGVANVKSSYGDFACTCSDGRNMVTVTNESIKPFLIS